jgi:hypothetical protein
MSGAIDRLQVVAEPPRQGPPDEMSEGREDADRKYKRGFGVLPE